MTGLGRLRAATARQLTAWLFLAPFLVLFCAMWLVPVARGLLLSATNTDLATGAGDLVWLDNYRALATDPVFHDSLGNTLVFVLESVPLLTAVALLLALLADVGDGRQILRHAVAAPYFITGSAVAIIWQFVLEPNTGLLNHGLRALGLPAQDWLAHPGTAMGAVVLITLWWRVGLPMLILLAALRGVPRELREAAHVDGANAWQRFRYVILPQIAPVLLFVVVTRLIESWKVFAQTYLVTGGGPDGSTRVVLQQLYEVGFQDFRTGYAAALAWALTLIILCCTLAQLVLFRRRTDG